MRHRQSIPPTSPPWDFCEEQLRFSTFFPSLLQLLVDLEKWEKFLYLYSPELDHSTPVVVLWDRLLQSYNCKGYIPRSGLLTGKTELTTPYFFFFFLQLPLFSSVFFAFFSLMSNCLMYNLLNDLEMSIDESLEKNSRGFFFSVFMIKKHIA